MDMYVQKVLSENSWLRKNKDWKYQQEQQLMSGRNLRGWWKVEKNDSGRKTACTRAAKSKTWVIHGQSVDELKTKQDKRKQGRERLPS